MSEKIDNIVEVKNIKLEEVGKEAPIITPKGTQK